MKRRSELRLRGTRHQPDSGFGVPPQPITLQPSVNQACDALVTRPPQDATGGDSVATSGTIYPSFALLTQTRPSPIQIEKERSKPNSATRASSTDATHERRLGVGQFRRPGDRADRAGVRGIHARAAVGVGRTARGVVRVRAARTRRVAARRGYRFRPAGAEVPRRAADRRPRRVAVVRRTHALAPTPHDPAPACAAGWPGRTACTATGAVVGSAENLHVGCSRELLRPESGRRTRRVRRRTRRGLRSCRHSGLPRFPTAWRCPFAVRWVF